MDLAEVQITPEVADVLVECPDGILWLTSMHTQHLCEQDGLSHQSVYELPTGKRLVFTSLGQRGTAVTLG